MSVRLIAAAAALASLGLAGCSATTDGHPVADPTPTTVTETATPPPVSPINALVCATLRANGVTGPVVIKLGLDLVNDQGMQPKKAGETIAQAALADCPEFVDQLKQVADSFDETGS